jgi:hypothetical protein
MFRETRKATLNCVYEWKMNSFVHVKKCPVVKHFSASMKKERLKEWFCDEN